MFNIILSSLQYGFQCHMCSLLYQFQYSVVISMACVQCYTYFTTIWLSVLDVCSILFHLPCSVVISVACVQYHVIYTIVYYIIFTTIWLSVPHVSNVISSSLQCGNQYGMYSVSYYLPSSIVINVVCVQYQIIFTRI